MIDILELGDSKQLFIDNRWFYNQRGMRLTVNPPIKDRIVLGPEMPWDDLSVGAYSTIHQGNGPGSQGGGFGIDDTHASSTRTAWSPEPWRTVPSSPTRR